MEGEWTQCFFENAPLQILDGDRGKNYPNRSEFTSNGYCIFLNTGNVTQSGFNFSEIDFISQERDVLLRKGKLQRQDVVLTTRGTVGNVAYLNQQIPYEHIRINSGMVILRPDQNFLDSRFLYLFLRSQLFSAQVEALRTGSAQPQLPIRDIKKVKISYPQLSEQKSIAHILGTLDDKIELNRQMNATLESMAQALFKSWFVGFDPVIDNALAAGNPIPEPFLARAKSRKALGDKRRPLPEAIQKQFPSCFVFTEEMGWIPEGWEVTSIYDLVNVIYGAPFKSEGFNSKGIGKPIIRIRDLKTGTPQYWSEEVHPKGTLVKSGDIAVGMDAEFRATIWYGENGYLNQRLFTVKPKIKNLNSFFIQSSIGPLLAIEENAQVGTTVAHLGKKDIDKFRLLNPSCSVVALYDTATGADLNRWVNLHAESLTLTNLRNTLLPKLLSGQLRIPDAEKLMADAL